MFNWLKNKLNSLLPQDIEHGLMSSNFCCIKLGTKIDVPDNMVCFVCYKDKTYLELPSGTYYLDEKSLKKLCLKQFGNKAEKKLKVDLFFVNLNEMKRKVKFKDKILISNKLTKATISANFKIKVINAKEFSNFVQAELNSPNVEKTNGVIEGYVEEFLRKFFLKKKLETNEIADTMLAELKEKATAFMLKMSLELVEFEIDINSQHYENEDKSYSFYENDSNSKSKIEPIKTEKIIDQTKKLEYTKADKENNNENSNCPICGNKLIKHSWYCHRYGYRVK